MTETLPKGGAEQYETQNSSVLRGSLSPEIVATHTAGLSSEQIAELIQVLQLQQMRTVAQERAESASVEEQHDLQLFAWQTEALESWRKANRKGVVEAVTGTGKTRVGLAAIQDARTQGLRTVVYVPSLALQNQWLEQIRSLLPNVHAIAEADSRANSDWDVTVITVQSAIRRRILPDNEQALLIADECHRYGSPQFQKGLRHDSYPIRLGLSATRTRGDSGDEILAKFFGNTCFNLDYQRAVHDELIAPFKVAFVRVPFTPTERHEYERLSVEMRDARTKLLGSVPAEPLGEFMAAVQQLANNRAERQSGLARWYLKRFSDRRSLLASSAQKQHALRALTPVVEASNGTLVFTQTKESAETSAQILNEEGVSSAAVDSGVDSDDRVEVIRLLGSGQMKALAAPTLLDEGIDLPQVDLGIVISATHQRRQMIQRFGRVLRKKPDGSIAKFVVFVLSGSSEDPIAVAHEPTLADELRPLAQAAEYFDLDVATDLERLVAFLDPSIDSHSIPSFEEITQAHPTGLHTDDGDLESDEVSVADEDFIFVPKELVEAEPIADSASVWELDEYPHSTDSERVILKRADSDPEEPSLFPDIAGPGDDGDKYYQNDIRKHSVLSREEEHALMERIRAGEAAQERIKSKAATSRAELKQLHKLVRAGDKARTYFIVSNLRLVASIARSTHPQAKRLELMDLIQYGNFGLLRAIEKFDHTRGTKFSTYAVNWIRQTMGRGIDDADRLIRVPVHAAANIRKVHKIKEAGKLERGTEPTVSDIAIRTGLSAEKVLDAVRAEWRIDPIEAVPLDLVDEEQSSFEEDVEALDIHAQLRDVMHTSLDGREERILKLRFGIDSDDGARKTLDEIGAEFGVTRERIRQIEAEARKKLRANLCVHPSFEERAETPDALALLSPAERDQIRVKKRRPLANREPRKLEPISITPIAPKNFAKIPAVPPLDVTLDEPNIVGSDELRVLLGHAIEGDRAATALEQRDNSAPAMRRNLNDLVKRGQLAKRQLESVGFISSGTSLDDLIGILNMVKVGEDQEPAVRGNLPGDAACEPSTAKAKPEPRTQLQSNLRQTLTRNLPSSNVPAGNE